MFQEGVLGDEILGLLNAIGYALNVAGLDSLNDGWRVVARELIPFLELLEAKAPESNQECSSLTKAWWRLAKIIYSSSMGGLESELSPELRSRLIESAARHIGMLRAVLRNSPKAFEEKNSIGEVSDFYRKAFDILLNFCRPVETPEAFIAGLYGDERAGRLHPIFALGRTWKRGSSSSI